MVTLFSKANFPDALYASLSLFDVGLSIPACMVFVHSPTYTDGLFIHFRARVRNIFIYINYREREKAIGRATQLVFRWSVLVLGDLWSSREPQETRPTQSKKKKKKRARVGVCACCGLSMAN